MKIAKSLAAYVLAVSVLPALSAASTLQVSVPEVVVYGAAAGTEFTVPISVVIPDGTSQEGLARLYIRLVSSDSANVIAPVAVGNRVTTTWASSVAGFNAKLSSCARDLDGDGDLDAADTAVVDLGANTNRNLGIGGSVLVLTQTWKFTTTPTAGMHYALAVQFPATPSRHYGPGMPVPFTSQQGIDGSVRVGGLQVQGIVTLQDLTTGAEVGKLLTLEIRSAGTLVDTLNSSLASGGAYSATGTAAAPGTYDLYFKVPHWLTKKITGVALTASTNVVNASLLNGDCNADDSVTVGDLSIVLAAMDAASGDPAWKSQADVDGDARVTSTDLSIALSNLDRTGDP